MIGKATTGSSFSGLTKYLTKDADRVAWTDTRGLVGTDPKEIAREMRAAADQSDRVEKPVYHLSLSFSAADAPTPEQMRTAGDRVLAELGLEDHQAFLVAHRDKEHPHLHIMVNRVHPATGKTWQGSHDYQQIERTLRTLEKEWRLTPTPGHHARGAGESAPDRSQTHAMGEIRRARRTGELPFPEQVRQDIGATFREAKSWDELSQRLIRYGYRIEPTARGMTITDGEWHAKASGIDPEGSRFKLEERFGERLDGYLQRERNTNGRMASPLGPPDIYHEVFGRPALSTPTLTRTGAVSPTVDVRKLNDQIFGPPALSPTMIEAAHANRAAAGMEQPLTHTVAAPIGKTSGFLPNHLNRPFSPAREVDLGQSGLGQSDRTGTAGALGFLAAAARPISSEEAEKDVVLRGVETGLRASVALAESRSERDNSDGHSGATLVDDDPAVKALVRDAEAYKEAERKEAALGKAIGEYAALEGKIREAAELERRARAYEKGFDEHLARTYQDADAAKAAFLTLSQQQSSVQTASLMRTDPERFGATREATRTKWLGLATETNKAPAYRTARSAADYGEMHVNALSRLPHAAKRAAWQKALVSTGREVEGLQRSLSGPFHKDRLLHRIAEHASSLSPERLSQAQHLFSPGAFRLVRHTVQKTLDVARGGHSM